MIEERAEESSGSHFTFAMGEFAATFPRDRLYVSNHMWAKSQANGCWRFGLSAYAVRLLQDVYFLDWLVMVGQPIQRRQTIGSVESKKAESDLFAPIGGTLRAINEQALEDPSVINADPYGDGWLIEIQGEGGVEETLLTPDGYAAHLTDAWEVAQRTIKGQANL